MATNPQLQKVIVDSLGTVPAASVFHHDRNLADAGLRTVGGRGRGGAQMTAADAAAELLVCVASPSVKDTVKVYNRYKSLLPHDPLRADELYATLPEVSAVLMRKHTFIDLLTAFVESAISGTLREHLTNRTPSPVEIVHAKALKFQFIGPHPMVDVKIPLIPQQSGISGRYADAGPANYDPATFEEWSRKLEKKNGTIGDLDEIRIFSGVTLLAVGDVLRKK